MTNRDLLKEARKVCERIEAAITSAAELIPDTIPEYIQALSHLRGACESSMAVQDWIDSALAAPEPGLDEIVRKVRETSVDGDKWLYSDDEAAALIESYGRRVPREFVNDIFHAGFNTARCLPHDGTIAIAAKYDVKIEEDGE